MTIDPNTLLEIAKALPLDETYEDGLQPAVRESSKTFLLAAKTVNTALAPIRIVVNLSEIGFNRLERSLVQKLNNVPVEKIHTPSLLIAGPTLEAIKFAAEEPILVEMYACLLATAMTTDTAYNAHPSFVEIIRQLTPDEAKILTCFIKTKDIPYVSIHEVEIATEDFEEMLKYFSLIGYDSECAFPRQISVYLNNLRRLGLIELRSDIRGSDPNAYTIIEKHEIIENITREISAKTGKYARVMQGLVQVTSYGEQFLAACLPKASA